MELPDHCSVKKSLVQIKKFLLSFLIFQPKKSCEISKSRKKINGYDEKKNFKLSFSTPLWVISVFGPYGFLTITGDNMTGDISSNYFDQVVWLLHHHR